MNAGSIEHRAGLLWLCALAALACERLTADPPPPPSRHEIPAAPPAALGAHLASSPAPAVVVEPPAHPAPESESEGDGESESAPDSAKKDAGTPPPPEGVTL